MRGADGVVRARSCVIVAGDDGCTHAGGAPQVGAPGAGGAGAVPAPAPHHAGGGAGPAGHGRAGRGAAGHGGGGAVAAQAREYGAVPGGPLLPGRVVPHAVPGAARGPGQYFRRRIQRGDPHGWNRCWQKSSIQPGGLSCRLRVELHGEPSLSVRVVRRIGVTDPAHLEEPSAGAARAQVGCGRQDQTQPLLHERVLPAVSDGGDNLSRKHQGGYRVLWRRADAGDKRRSGCARRVLW